MKNLLQSFETLPQGWREKNIMLFLDYDGTLSPIADTPDKAVLPPENKELLKMFAGMPQCQIVIISGRALVDIERIVGVEGIDYIGNHGWEIDGPHIRFESLVPPQIMAALEQISNELATKLSGIQGVLIEDKGITLSVHYRLVSEDQVPLVRQIFDRVCVPYSRQNKVKIHQGKKVLEIRPAIEWDKGKAALWFLKKQLLVWGNGNVLPFYVGDDITDEEAFRAIKDKGVTVFVGAMGGSSHAEYYLESPQDVTQFLKQLAEEMQTVGQEKPA
jgi:trehalose-phosphatase